MEKWAPQIKRAFGTEHEFRQDVVDLIKDEHEKGPRKLLYSERHGIKPEAIEADWSNQS